MTDFQETYYCDTCPASEPSTTGNPMRNIDGLQMCDNCFSNYTPIAERTCGLCSEVFEAKLDKFQTFHGAKLVCGPCLDYNSANDTKMILKKL